MSYNRKNHNTLAVSVSDLVKVFGRTRAVDSVDLKVPAGIVYGLLGPNGAGKTTIIRILATLLKPDKGAAVVLGHDVVREAAAVRRRISMTGQFTSVDEDLTGFENIVLLGRLFGYTRVQGRKRADELLHAFKLADAANRQVKNYSGGMKRRLDIAASIIVTPDLLFLDEPTTGLDPRSRNQVWSIVRALVAEGTTVLLTTQYLDEADRLAERIAVIDRGKVIAEGTSGDLKASVGSSSLHIRLRNPEKTAAAISTLQGSLGLTAQKGTDPAAFSIRATNQKRAADALQGLTGAGIEIAEFSLGRPSLDEVFLALTGQAVEEDEQTKVGKV